MKCEREVTRLPLSRMTCRAESTSTGCKEQISLIQKRWCYYGNRTDETPRVLRNTSRTKAWHQAKYEGHPFENLIREIGLKNGLVDVKVCTVDEEINETIGFFHRSYVSRRFFCALLTQNKQLLKLPTISGILARLSSLFFHTMAQWLHEEATEVTTCRKLSYT